MANEDEPVFFIARPKWWNLVGRYRWWRFKRDLRAGIYQVVYYVPGDDHERSN